MDPKTLDHVAYWLADRDAVAGFAIAHLGMHVIDRTDAFTLVGADARALRGVLGVPAQKPGQAVAAEKSFAVVFAERGDVDAPGLRRK